MLQGDDLTLSLGGRILGPISLGLGTGEVLGLSGPSGSGKTSLARVLAGLDAPLSGRVRRPEGRVIYLHQAPRSAFNPRWRLGRSLAEGGPWDADLAAALGLQEGWLSAFPHELSGGELARISIARGLFAKPAVLIADEITAELDPVSQAQVWQAMRAQKRMGLLVISHNEALLDHLSHRRIRL